MTEPARPAPDPDESDRVVIRDKRKIDPVTGQARTVAEPGAAPVAPAGEPGQVPMVEAALLDERTRDLQRVQAEYANYRKRADRDRVAAGNVAVSQVLTELLPVLDDIDRARTHDDLTGALKAVADHLDNIFGKVGLESFGEVGDPFDPTVHEAVMHTESDDVTQPTCTIVMRRGYRHADRLLRPAMVGVTEPATPNPPAVEQPAEAAADVSTDGDTQAQDTDPLES